jgi:hypothetical protein
MAAALDHFRPRPASCRHPGRVVSAARRRTGRFHKEPTRVTSERPAALRGVDKSK